MMFETSGENAQGETCSAVIDIGRLKTAWHWYDFICPFCYVARSRNEILRRCGLLVIELPLQVHPEIPAEGVAMGPRSGELYEYLEREARDALLPLRWPTRLPNSRYALQVAERTRRNHLSGFAALYDQFFASHFALGEDIGDPGLVDRYAKQVGADVARLVRAMQNGCANEAVKQSEQAASEVGVASTPTWLVEGRQLNGLKSKTFFERLGWQIKNGGCG